MGEGKLAFGDLGFQEEESQSAFLYYRDNGKYRIFYRLSTESVVRNQYVTNMPYLELPYLASFDNAGYILFLDETPHIGKVISDTEGIFELPRFPQDFRTRPRLERQPGWADLRQVTAFYRILESSSTVKALYAWNQHIYLLARQSLEWWLIKLDPRDGAELLRTRLPTSAANLTAEPETHGWILTERASVEGVGELHAPYMETLAQVYIPANWMYRNQTGLSPAEPRDECISIGPSKEERRP
jgi:hypothetical protein